MSRVKLPELPLPLGADVLTQEPDDFFDLVQAAASSLDFWDYPLDDEDWNED